MSKTISVGEAKRRFSELMSRVVYAGERFIIERKGKPMIAVVRVEDLKKLEATPTKETKGLLAAVGAWEEFEDLDEIVAQIYEFRKRERERKVSGFR